MKQILLAVVGFGLVLPTLQAEAPVAIPVVTPQEAAQHEGKVVTVKGKVDGQRTAASGTTFMNFGGRHPNQVFSCRAFAEKFPDGVPACEGKTVEVTGKIKMHEGKPSIDLSGPDKLKILESEPAADTPTSE
jgi:DNA/RNA endonuclease YhcR with UshA esterase domain